ncbi:hypothetical protein DITRI_Ditri02bG0157800 [Diplodiscus trichospermus]
MEVLSIPVWVQFLLLFSLLFLAKRKQGAARRSDKRPPGPPKLPIIGNLHLLGVLPHRSLQQLSNKYGPVLLLKLGSVSTVIISSAETARQVLQAYDLECCSRPLLASTGKLSYNYLDLSFTPYGNYWREMRKICVLELFSVGRVQSYQFIREEEVGLMIDSISQSSSTGNPVNLSQRLMIVTTEIICRIAFGRSSFRDGGFNVQKFQEQVHEAMGFLGSFSAQKQQGEDIIDVLLKISKNQSNEFAVQITHNHIKAILMNIFLAGLESGATVVEWVMTELTRNPRVMKKAQEEIRNYVGKKGKVSESDSDHLQYLKLVVKEALRLHPPAALLTRESRSQFNINGYNFYPKTHIYVNVWAIGRDPKSWENPDQFYPERFMDSSIDFKGKHFEFLPFGAGRRGCPGMNMGMLNVELALASLLYHFDWKLPNGLKAEDLKMEEAAGLANYKKEALVLVPIKYQETLQL